MKRKQYTVAEKIRHVKLARASGFITSYLREQGINPSNYSRWAGQYDSGLLKESNAVAVSSSVKTKVYLVDGLFVHSLDAAIKIAGNKETGVITEFDMVRVLRPKTKTVVEWG